MIIAGDVGGRLHFLVLEEPAETSEPVE